MRKGNKLYVMNYLFFETLYFDCLLI